VLLGLTVLAQVSTGLLGLQATVKQQIMNFMNAFHQESVQLERLNRSYRVLLPKKPGAVAVNSFRPI